MRHKLIKMVTDNLRYKIFVAIPSLTGNMRIELTVLLMKMLFNGKYFVKIYMEQGKPIDFLRNKIVKIFLAENQISDEKYDYLLFIDDDIVPPENILDMIELKKDIISAVCFTFLQDEPLALILNKTNNPFVDGYIQSKKINKKEIIECDAVGTGCLLIKREVLEKIESPFEFRIENDVIKGEDYNFCEKAKKLGYKIFVDTTKICSHFNNIDLKKINNLLVKA